MENVLFGTHLLKTTLVKHEKHFSAAITISADQPSATLADMMLQPASTELKEISDRIVVNVENRVVNAGIFAFDRLERSQGILIDANDNISMRGRPGFIIMIDGKPSPMSGADMLNYLRSLPPMLLKGLI